MARHPLIDKPAPTFSLPGADGQTYTVTPGAKGVPTVLFFYPKSGTYGCTKEACQFRDALDKDTTFKEAGVEVVGVSPDPVDKQKEFVDKHKLTYPVLSDAKGEARKAYHVGKGLFGLAESARVTFIIDSKGTVRDVLDTTLNYSAHVKFVTNWLRKNGSKKDAEAPAASTTA
ncbi:AhpC-TSA-domain-containing protein, partial [Trametes sanguinea]